LEGRGGGAFAGEGGGCLAVLALVALEDLAHGVAISVRVADRVSPLEIFSCAARSGLSCGPSLEESRRRKKELGTKAEGHGWAGAVSRESFAQTAFETRKRIFGL